MKRIVVVTLLFAIALCAADPFVGTWKLNVAKSKSELPMNKSATVTIKAIDNGHSVSLEGVSADGKPAKTGFTAKFDGKDYSVTGSTFTDTITVRRVSSNVLESTGKKAGKVVSTSRVTVSMDGKMLTMETKRTMPDGKTLHSTTVYERQ
jgi:hypothetical protein